MYKTIILPIDLAHEERTAPMLEAAQKLAGEGSKIVFVNIVEEVPSHMAPEFPSDILEKAKNHARDSLKGLAATTGVETEIEVKRGKAPSGILDIADKKGADLIVIASHKPGWGDFLLGSTAARVVRHAQCSVHVIR